MPPLAPEDAERLKTYQMNTVFVGFMALVCTAALVYLTRNLSSVLVPLMWAAFTAMPLTGLIKVLNPAIIRMIRCFTDRGYRAVNDGKSPDDLDGKAKRYVTRHFNSDVDFRAIRGEAFIRLPKEDGQALLKEVNQSNRGRLYIRSCCRRRVKVKGLLEKVTPIDDDAAHQDRPRRASEEWQSVLPHARMVNRIVDHWEYYIREVKDPGGANVGDNEVAVELFLDHAEHYPVLNANTTDEHLDRLRDMKGKLEVDTTHTVSYSVAVFVAMCFVLLCMGVFIWLVSAGANSLSKNVDTYVHGGREFIEWAYDYAKEVLPEEISKDLDRKAQNLLNERLPEMASSLLTLIEGLGFEILIFLLYLLFWTLEPLPINGKVAGLFRTYLLQKSLVCLIFATLTSALLLFLQCPLWAIFWLVAFFLNYIPEVGPIVCYVIMLPLILLDGNQSMHDRLVNTIVFTTFFLVFKFVTGNIIEVQLYAKSGGDLMRMHPVVMLAMMMLFESLMGMTGMFMTVPVMAAGKYYMLSMKVPNSVQDPLLVCLEGSEMGPHMNFVDQQRAHTEQISVLDDSDDTDSDLEMSSQVIC